LSFIIYAAPGAGAQHQAGCHLCCSRR